MAGVGRFNRRQRVAAPGPTAVGCFYWFEDDDGASNKYWTLYVRVILDQHFDAPRSDMGEP
jgi:hypothetical protein